MSRCCQRTTPAKRRSQLHQTAFLCLAAVLTLVPGVVTGTTDPQPAAARTDAGSDAAETRQDCGDRGGEECGCGEMGGGKMGGGKGKGRACGREAREGASGSGHRGRPEAGLIHFLIDNHEAIERQVENLPSGVRTRTVATDPELIEPLRQHARQMHGLLRDGGRIRNWDPLFREIFDHRDAIEMEITDIDGGVEILETSTDGEVVKLIQAHAAKVDEFVARGREAYRETTPLPEDYGNSIP